MDGQVPLPRFYAAQIHYPRPRIQDLGAALQQELDRLDALKRIRPGMQVAIAIGSRGIAGLPVLVSRLGEALKSQGARPFIVPAMGSHGGGTALGQAQFLAGQGISPDTVGMEVRSSMEVVRLGETSDGLPVYLDRCAYESDGIILVNRVKEHTDFEGPIQSGLMKLLAVGLGNAEGARLIHSRGAADLPRLIPSIARYLLGRIPILWGIALVDNAYGEPALLRLALPALIEETDRTLLEQAREWTPRLPFRQLEALVVCAIGKDISGAGMDTKTIGRIRMAGVPEPTRPAIRHIVVLDMTPASRGNATGLGLADVTTRRLAEKIDYESFYLNQLSAGHLEGAKVPLMAASDQEAIQLAVQTGWSIPPERLRAVVIQDTKHMADLFVSTAALPEMERKVPISVDENPFDLRFDSQGTLVSVPGAYPSP